MPIDCAMGVALVVKYHWTDTFTKAHPSLIHIIFSFFTGSGTAHLQAEVMIMIQLPMLLIYLDHLDNDGGDDDYDGKKKKG